MTGMVDLPREIRRYIFSFLDVPDLLLRVLQVCKTWQECVQDDALWKGLLARDFGAKVHTEGWKDPSTGQPYTLNIRQYQLIGQMLLKVTFCKDGGKIIWKALNEELLAPSGIGWAIRFNCDQLISRNLKICPDLLSWEGNAIEDPPLHEAAKGPESVEALQALVDAGAKVDRVDIFDCTALHRAVEAKNTEGVTVLLTAQASVRVKNDLQQTPLDIALKNEWTEGIQLLAPKDEEGNPISPPPIPPLPALPLPPPPPLFHSRSWFDYSLVVMALLGLGVVSTWAMWRMCDLCPISSIKPVSA